jgi:protein-S-isoprenylcysteine O-methyltransferase Ste14
MSWETLTAENAARWAGWLWTLLLAVWLLLWFGMKKAKKLESPGERLQHAIPVTVGFWLMFGGMKDWGWLNARVLARIPAIWMPGLLLTVLGVAIAIYARLSLGSNWSTMVTLKSGHQLIRTGLYSRIRHPIYTGILLAMVGTALIRDHVRSWLGVALVLGSFYFKARREEALLRQEFGEEFEEHMRRTGMFLPKVS